MCNPNPTSTPPSKNHLPPGGRFLVDPPPPPPPPLNLYLNLHSLPMPTKSHFQNPKKSTNSNSNDTAGKIFPAVCDIIDETKALFKLSSPIALTALILYTRSIISMLFLGQLGETELAAGSLAIAFANITGYSVLSGLALGMEPLCSQAFGAHRPKVMSVTLHRTLATWSNPTRECLTGWGPLVRLATPSCVSVCLEWWWYEIMIVLCGLLVNPNATVASMGILIQTTALLYVFPSSLSFAVSTRVGNELGANRPNKARVSAMVAVFFAGLMGLSAMVFATSMRETWGKMFTNDSDILKLTSAALPIIGLCELGNCPQTVGCGVVRGTARPTTAANVNLGAFYLVGTPVAVGLGFGLGVGFIGLWVGLLSAQVCCAGLMLYVVGTTDWEHQAKKAEMLTCNGDTSSLDHDIENQPLICIMVTSS
nr:protein DETOXIFICATION 51-like [Tanacetum cinerariifolium]